MHRSFTILGRPFTIEVAGLSYLYIEINRIEFVYDRHAWFELSGGVFRHWLLEKKPTAALLS